MTNDQPTRRRRPGTEPAETAVPSAIIEKRPSAIWQGVTYHLKRVKRGGKFTNTAYWYAYWHDQASGKTKTKYVGREFGELEEKDFS